MPGEQHWEFQVTVPAHTLKTAPIVTPTVLPARVIDEIKWMIPPGASGFTGWRISMGGVQIIPVNLGAWLIRDGSAEGAALSRLPNTGQWDVTAYNTGNFPHTIYVTFLATPLRPTEPLITPFGLDEFQPGIFSPLAHRPRSDALWPYCRRTRSLST